MLDRLLRGCGLQQLAGNSFRRCQVGASRIRVRGLAHFTCCEGVVLASTPTGADPDYTIIYA